MPVCMHAACPAYTQAGYLVTSACTGTAAGATCTPGASCDSGAGYLGIVVPSAATCSSAGAWASSTVLSGCSATRKRYSHPLATHLSWLQPLTGHLPGMATATH